MSAATDGPAEKMVDTAGAPVAAGAPVLRVVSGDPSAAELAALVAALAAVAAAGGEGAGAPTRPTSQWAHPARAVGMPPRPAPHAWRAASWPH